MKTYSEKYVKGLRNKVKKLKNAYGERTRIIASLIRMVEENDGVVRSKPLQNSPVYGRAVCIGNEEATTLTLSVEQLRAELIRRLGGLLQ